MTHLHSAAQVFYLSLWDFFQHKFRFFSFSDSLRHGLGDLQTNFRTSNYGIYLRFLLQNMDGNEQRFSNLSDVAQVLRLTLLQFLCPLESF